MTEHSRVSGQAWSELLHAEVAFLLRSAGIPVLHIKGPTVALWLYDDGERRWGDVDVLVAPSRMDEALATLLGAGFLELYPGVNRQTSTDHAITLAQVDAAGQLQSEIDVHDRFLGIDGDPERAFELLWRRREPDRLGHQEVWFPDLATRALLVALNTARTDTAQAREDLARLIAAGDPDGWQDVVDLATQVQALPALRAGIEVDPAGADLVREIGLADVPVSPEWALRRAGAPRTALRIEELSRLPWRRRVGQVARWLLPSPAIIRMRDPRASGSVRRLAAGYLRRWRDGIVSVRPSAGALARIRRHGHTDDSSVGDSSS